MQSDDGFALTLFLSPRRESPELCARLGPLNPPSSGARDGPARSGSECNRRLGEGSGTSRLSEPLRPGTGRAPKEGSWKGNRHRPSSDCSMRIRQSPTHDMPGNRRTILLLLGEKAGMRASVRHTLFSAREADCCLEAGRTSRHDSFMIPNRYLSLLACLLWPLCSPGESMNDALARATAAVQAATPRALADPARPIFHITAPAQWINDPNGPIFYKGYYHLFYQLDPFSDKGSIKYWGHVRSRDLAKWEHLPLA